MNTDATDNPIVSNITSHHLEDKNWNGFHGNECSSFSTLGSQQSGLVNGGTISKGSVATSSQAEGTIVIDDESFEQNQRNRRLNGNIDKSNNMETLPEDYGSSLLFKHAKPFTTTTTVTTANSSTFLSPKEPIGHECSLSFSYEGENLSSQHCPVNDQKENDRQRPKKLGLPRIQFLRRFKPHCFPAIGRRFKGEITMKGNKRNSNKNQSKKIVEENDQEGEMGITDFGGHNGLVVTKEDASIAATSISTTSLLSSSPVERAVQKSLNVSPTEYLLPPPLKVETQETKYSVCTTTTNHFAEECTSFSLPAADTTPALSRENCQIIGPSSSNVEVEIQVLDHGTEITTVVPSQIASSSSLVLHVPEIASSNNDSSASNNDPLSNNSDSDIHICGTNSSSKIECSDSNDECCRISCLSNSKNEQDHAKSNNENSTFADINFADSHRKNSEIPENTDSEVEGKPHDDSPNVNYGFDGNDGISDSYAPSDTEENPNSGALHPPMIRSLSRWCRSVTKKSKGGRPQKNATYNEQSKHDKDENDDDRTKHTINQENFYLKDLQNGEEHQHECKVLPDDGSFALEVAEYSVAGSTDDTASIYNSLGSSTYYPNVYEDEDENACILNGGNISSCASSSSSTGWSLEFHGKRQTRRRNGSSSEKKKNISDNRKALYDPSQTRRLLLMRHLKHNEDGASWASASSKKSRSSSYILSPPNDPSFDEDDYDCILHSFTSHCMGKKDQECRQAGGSNGKVVRVKEKKHSQLLNPLNDSSDQYYEKEDAFFYSYDSTDQHDLLQEVISYTSKPTK